MPAESTSQASTPHASRGQLAAVFMLALVVFIGLRWQPAIWVESQLQQQAKQHGITIAFKHLQIQTFFTLQAEQMSIQTPQLPTPIVLDALTLAPDWSSLVTGDIGIKIHTQWQAHDIQALIIKQTDSIILQDLVAIIDASTLQPILDKALPLPLKTYGQLQLSGSIELNADAHPVQGHLNLSWNTAAIDFATSRIALGDYQLALQSDTANSPWQWSLAGGDALMLAGKGEIDTSAQKPQTWQLNGSIRIEASNTATSLASLLGNKATEFRISGNITHPQLQPF